MWITAAMDALAGRLADHTDRPVTTDPTRTSNTPCVLVEPPTVEPATGTLCGQYLYRYNVLCIGLPGARAELGPLAELLEDVTAGLDDIGVGWTLAEPVAYVPVNPAEAADPCQAYRIVVEELS
ncbi:hypothetical protein [Streptomyces alboflavus]|uniref:hypothetical protein n=1 Tax=Streptomyces alboflavus TaxID=67267 RepID=UPI0036B4EFA6